VGPSSHIERALAEIRPALRAPLVSWSPTETDRLPETACQTLIVRDVDCLTARQQASLAALASHSAGDLQIVSTARQHVFPLVCEGRFLDALYYQLNVVLLEFFSGRRTRGA
jgi:transcriptional regulator of acetoin/glycerol metabolism